MSKDKAEAAERRNAESKMKMIEKAMHGKNAGKRESKNYRGKGHKCSKGCNCN
jgi:hypothetical protein